MGLLYGPRRAILGGKRPYFKKVLATGPIAYWPQWELTGSVSEDLVLAAQDGAYTGVTLNALPGPDGSPAPFFDGANDFNNVFSATLQGRFNGSEGTVAAWVRVNGAGVWIDGALRYIVSLRVDGDNQIVLDRTVNNNELQWYYEAGNVIESIVIGGFTTTDWFHLALTWSAAGDEVRAYYDGVQVGATQTVLGVWAGNLDASRTNIGCNSNIAPSNVWHGYISHPAVWDRPLSPDEIANLAVV